MHVLLLYYVFILSFFSYCVQFWFNNNRSGRYKLINKIDRLLSTLAKKNGFNFDDFVTNFYLYNAYVVYMYEATFNCIIIVIITFNIYQY